MVEQPTNRIFINPYEFWPELITVKYMFVCVWVFIYSAYTIYLCAKKAEPSLHSLSLCACVGFFICASVCRESHNSYEHNCFLPDTSNTQTASNLP